MALWLPNNRTLYLPPTPVARILSTDEFVTRTKYFYHAESERLLTVGNPYYEIKNLQGTVTVPKVSSSQYRVFRITFPDPNKFALTDPDIYNPDTERLVWGLRGIEIGRGGPLGIGITGNPLLNRFDDVENTGKYNSTFGEDNRQNIGFDPKQTQMFLLGCTPPLGEHWAQALRCDNQDPPAQMGDCPPIELVNSIIEDGDMADTGFGNMDFKTLQANRADTPIDISNTICKYPDFLKMGKDHYGDPMFFYARREQHYTRHYFTHAGTVGEPIPTDMYLIGNSDTQQAQATVAPSNYFGTPSGSLVSTDSQLFNRPYWLQRAQGKNNGICWENQLFLTVVDTTRGTNLCINVASQAVQDNKYDARKYKEYLRHTEEYELSFILQLCVVPLTNDVLAHIYAMNPDILENWNLGVNPPPNASLEDKYRFIESLATRCPDKVPPKERVDPYDKYKFWNVDLSEALSSDLDNFPLGRKFLYQSGLSTVPRSISLTRKRKVTVTKPTKSKKRKSAA
ncbi:major capsid protein [Sus scrofa papillomavirus 2]|uniref:Major capsid protein L1 n=1 Tax=Sus scrofa papillomavirus 2 TaxID=2025338 RepID=A0A223FQV2_9PAPI|nr:major capsid protein [Sus scrofa papillomavirus 2]AST11579.1 major capsid protein [Sus scrofa papillomavirus 2]